jgi:imidazolonepropionase-like amidohydrolase
LLRIACLAWCLAFPAGAVAQAVIERVTVLTMTAAGVLANHDVTIEGDRIAAVAPHGSTPASGTAQRIDGRGLYLMPGMTEMHGHVPSPEREADFTADVLFLFVARGVTTVRSMLGQPGQLPLRDRIRRDGLVAPTLFLAGPGFSRGVGDAEAATRRVEQQASEGWDLLKIFNGLPAPAFDALATRARQVGIPFGGHVPTEVGIERALIAGMRTIEHLDGYIEALRGDEAEVPEAALRGMAQRTKAAGAGVVPTMGVWDNLLRVTPFPELQARDELAYLPRALRDSWMRHYQDSPGFRDRLADTVKRAIGRGPDMISHNRKRLLKAMDEADVEILFGADTPQVFVVPGFSAYREAKAMEAAGMSRARILASATATPGRYFAATDRFGVVAAGMRADLVLLGGNPLDSLEALGDVRGVVLRGRFIGAEALAAGLADIRRRQQ